MTSYNKALKLALEYFNGDELAATTFLGKYALTTPNGDILEPTPDLMHRRLAKEFARIEAKYPNPMSEEEIFNLFDKFSSIIPQGSPMSAIGNPYQIQSLSNCFVVPVGDSYGWILKADQELAHIYRRRGGAGLDISALRPINSKTKNAAGSSTGIGSFMERFSNTTREVGQSGRRGANMQTISVHHPEVKTFINIKKDRKKVTGSNISVRITNEFMTALANNADYEQRWPVDSKEPSIKQKVSAKEIWDEIIAGAWESAEPGVLFWDTILEESPADCYGSQGFTTRSTNPCAELPLAFLDACRLIVINLMCCVENAFQKNAAINWSLLKTVAYKAQRLMDDLVDLEIEAIDKIIAKIESDPEPAEVKKIEMDLWLAIKEKCQLGRRTGLGPTAVGDLLASLGVRYGSEDGIRIVEHIYRTIALASYECSIDLAEERGAFPIYDFNLEKDHKFLSRIWAASPSLFVKYQKHGRRNIANLTTAPCGTVSLLAQLVPGVYQTTSGIECVYLPFYKRRKKINANDKEARVDFVDDMGDKWQEFTVFHPGFKVWMERNNKTEQEVSESPYWKATAMDLDWLSGVQVQAAAQKWVDHSISRTQNLPSDVSKETVSEIYMTAYKLGCKGFTIYRDGSRSGVLVSETKEETKSETSNLFKHNDAPKRPKELNCDVYHCTVNGEKWTIFVGLLDGKPYEVMGGLAKHVKLPKRVKTGKIVKHNGEINPARYDFHYDFEKPEDETIIQDIGNIFENSTNSAFSRILSLSLRHGSPVQYVVEQLIKGSDKDSDLFSFSKVMSRVLKTYVKDGTKPSQKKCEACGSTNLAFQQGCVSCLDCSHSKCG